MEPKNNAELVIARFGGQSALAALIGRRQSTVQHWASTGMIPTQWHRRLLDVARQKGIMLEPKDFTPATRRAPDPATGVSAPWQRPSWRGSRSRVWVSVGLSGR
jgi:hypothetical protein